MNILPYGSAQALYIIDDLLSQLNAIHHIQNQKWFTLLAVPHSSHTAISAWPEQCGNATQRNANYRLAGIDNSKLLTWNLTYLRKFIQNVHP